MVLKSSALPFSIPTLELCILSIPTLELCILAGAEVVLRAPRSQACSCPHHWLSRVSPFRYEFLKNMERNEN